MGSSGGSSNFKAPSMPTPPNGVPYGQTAPFTPSYVNFLGDPSVPSTGLTPQMLQQINSGAYMPKPPPPPAMSADRDLMAQIMAQLQKPQGPRLAGQRPGQSSYFSRRLTGAQRNSGGR